MNTLRSILLISCILVSFNSFAKNIIKVAVIDTGLQLDDPRFKDILCETGHKDFTGEGIEDHHGHGSHVVGIIKNNALPNKSYCLIIYKFYSDRLMGFQTSINIENSFQAAMKEKVDIVNFSGGGTLSSYEEYRIIKDNPQVLFIVAAGNNDSELNDNFYPASYNLQNIISVGCLDQFNEKCNRSNYGSNVKAWEIGWNVLSTLPGYGMMGRMSGTSQATAVYTGKLIRYLK